MFRCRVPRVIALLVLTLAQAALVLPHEVMGETMLHARPAGGMTRPDCPHGAAGGATHSRAPIPRCGSCPASMPTDGGGCVGMTSCGASSATAMATSLGSSLLGSAIEPAPAITPPAGYDCSLDPPPPRA